MAGPPSARIGAALGHSWLTVFGVVLWSRGVEATTVEFGRTPIREDESVVLDGARCKKKSNEVRRAAISVTRNQERRATHEQF